MLERRAYTRTLSLLCSAVLLATAPRIGSADEGADAHAEALRRRIEALQEQEAEEARQRAEWQSRAAERRRAVASAREKLAEIETSRIMAQDGAYKGVKRSEWKRRQQEAEKALREAENELDALHEDARQSEIPPGWLDDDSDDAASADD